MVQRATLVLGCMMLSASLVVGGPVGAEESLPDYRRVSEIAIYYVPWLTTSMVELSPEAVRADAPIVLLLRSPDAIRTFIASLEQATNGSEAPAPSTLSNDFRAVIEFKLEVGRSVTVLMTKQGQVRGDGGAVIAPGTDLRGRFDLLTCFVSASSPSCKH